MFCLAYIFTRICLIPLSGFSIGIDGFGDIATIKYAPNGTQEWVIRYDGPDHKDDGAARVALDSDGNLYLTGISWGDGTSFDSVTIKYSPNGTQEWIARYNGPANDVDGTFAIALDDFGNIFVTGLSLGIGTYLDYITIKYSQAITAELRVEPEIISLKAKGVFSVFITLPEDFDVRDIDPSTVTGNGVYATKTKAARFQFVAHFSRDVLIPDISPTEASIIIEGLLYDGTPFRGQTIVDIKN